MVWLEYFQQYKKIENSNKKVEQLQKLISEVQRKQSKTEKTKKVYFHTEKHTMCTKKIRKSKYTQKRSSYRILEYTVFDSRQGKCC